MREAAFSQHLASRIRRESRALAQRWLDRLHPLLPVAPNEVFPSADLLDHIPALLHEIGSFLQAPEAEEIGANTSVILKARELGLLRHSQRASVHQLLREYELLGRILQAFVHQETAALEDPPSAADCIGVMGRLNRAVQMLMQTTIDTFVARYSETIAEQTARLESFNRMVGHELRNPLSTLFYAVAILRQPATAESEPDRNRVLDLMQRNCDRMRDLLDNISRITRDRAEQQDAPSTQRVETAAIAREVARQLRQMAAARGVEIRVADDLPVLLVDPARLELVLMNLVSNGIKYADPGKPERSVDIASAGRARGDQVGICVRDNGLGIPADALPNLFRRFFRAHADRDGELKNEGFGLGLSIVQDCVRAMGGEIEVESREGAGTGFTIVLPQRDEPAPKARS